MRSLLTVTLAFFAFAPASAGEKLPSEAGVRQAIVKSLPFVEKDGLAWIKKRDCMSCHTVTFMLWAHNEAADHGVPVDRTKLAEWTDWSMKKSLTSRVLFKFDPKSLESLPKEIQPKLAKLAQQSFPHEKDLLEALSKNLSAEELKEHRPLLIKTASQAKKTEVNDGGGLDTMSQLFLAFNADFRKEHAKFYQSTADLIVGMQPGNGIWAAGGQLPRRRWAKPVADQTTTLWTILALAGYDAPPPQVQKSLAKAHEAVKKPATDDNFEWLIARLLYENQFGTPEQKDLLKKQVLARQNEDGGWSVMSKGKSDALSTGQGLYALRVLGFAPNDTAIRRAQKFLIDTQTEDGSWTVAPELTSVGNQERYERLTPIYRNWGTSWATIGLAKSLPGK